MKTEIEIRGRLSKADFENLLRLFQKDALLVDHYNRLSVDVSPGFDIKTRRWENSSGTDIRLKKSDDKEKLSIKTGSFDEKERKEIEVKLEAGQFLKALDFLEILGFQTGMIYQWESWEFKYKNAEVKLSKLTDNYFTFEIEGKDSSAIETLAKELSLRAYSKDEYRKAIDWENQNIHQLYSKEAVESILKSDFNL
jgi:adenylate cyclase class IV